MKKYSTPETDSKETAALHGTISDPSSATAGGQDIDKALADVLARSAALPELTADEYASLDERVDADIRLVVERSALRLRFPKPGELAHDCDALPDHGSRRGPRVQVARANGRPLSVHFHNVLSACMAVESPAPVFVLARTSEAWYTAYFRTSVHPGEKAARQSSAREVADRMLSAIADDVGRRQSRADRWWQMSIALVAAQNESCHEPGPHGYQWWTLDIAEEDFSRLLERHRHPAISPRGLQQDRRDQAPAPVVEPIPLCRIEAGTPRGSRRGGLRPYKRVAGRPQPLVWVMQKFSAFWWLSVQPFTWLAEMSSDWAYRTVTRSFDQAALRLRLPEPPPPAQPSAVEASQSFGAARAKYRVLVDRELAGSV